MNSQKITNELLLHHFFLSYISFDLNSKGQVIAQLKLFYFILFKKIKLKIAFISPFFVSSSRKMREAARRNIADRKKRREKRKKGNDDAEEAEGNWVPSVRECRRKRRPFSLSLSAFLP